MRAQPAARGLGGLLDRRHVHRAGLAALAGLPQQQRLVLLEDARAAGRPARRSATGSLPPGDPAGQHRGAALQVAGADLDADRHALELPVDRAPAERGVGAVVDLDAQPGRLQPVADLADLGQNRLVVLDRQDDDLDVREPRRHPQPVVVAVRS